MTPLVLDQRCITVFHKVQLRGGSMAAATSKMECLVIIAALALDNWLAAVNYYH